MENRSNLKGLKPRLPDKQPGNTFSLLPISSQVTNTVVKAKHKKHWKKHKHIHCHQAELKGGCLHFWLPLLSFILEESQVRGRKKQESDCKITALLYPKLEV